MRGAEPTAGDVERLSSRTPDMPERQRYSAQNRCSARDHHGWAQTSSWANERATEQTNKNKKNKEVSVNSCM